MTDPNSTYLSSSLRAQRSNNQRHCEARSDVAIPLDWNQSDGDCFVASLLIAMDAQSTRDARGAGPGMYAENAAVRRSGAFFCRNDGFLWITGRNPENSAHGNQFFAAGGVNCHRVVKIFFTGAHPHGDRESL